MQYLCGGCNQVHEGWPPYMFQYPEEFLGLSPEDKRQKAMKTKDGFIILKDDHAHAYKRAIWDQKVEGSKYDWRFVVWVMIHPDYAADLVQCIKLPDELEATLGSKFDWYGPSVANYPLNIKWDEEEKFYRVVDVDRNCDKNGTIAKDFYKGLPLDFAKQWFEHYQSQGLPTMCGPF